MPSNPQPLESKTTATSTRHALAAVLLQRQARLWPRFLALYARLQRLPRSWRRRLGRKAAASLAGVALLLALGRTPSNNVAHAATITVDDGRVTIADDGFCSLPEAIISANDDDAPYDSVDECEDGTPGEDIISLPPGGNFTLTDYLDDFYYSGLPPITSEITIQGNGATIQRDDDEETPYFNLFTVLESGDLTINNVTLRNGANPSYGGGAVYIYGGAAAINDSTLTGNKAFFGGALLNVKGTLEINNSELAENYAFFASAVAVVDESETQISETVIRDNRALTGGAVSSMYISGDSAEYLLLTISHSEITGNQAYFDFGCGCDDDYVAPFYAGGGVVNLGGSVALYYTVVSENSASIGGGVMNVYGQMAIDHSLVSGNEVSYAGGGVFNYYGQLFIHNSTISGNESGYVGGGVFNGSGELRIINSTVSGNSAEYGGGLYNTLSYDDGYFPFDPAMTLINTTVTRNTATIHGGGIDAVAATLNLHRSLISGNNAPEASELYVHDDDPYFVPYVYSGNFNLFGHEGVNDDAAFHNFAPTGNDRNATSDGAYSTPLKDILQPTLALNGGLFAGVSGMEQPIRTHGLVQYSPAIDAAPSDACSFEPYDVDQRGMPRNQNGDGLDSDYECDIGAFEGFVTVESAVYMTADKPGVVNGVAFGKEDILQWDGSSWTKFFDGSDAGLTAKHDINAIHVVAEDDIYLSFFQNKIKTTTIGQVLGHDIIHYDGSDFSLFFDGSDVGLTATAEKIDALHIPEDSSTFPGGQGCDTYLLISTLGNAKVPGLGAVKGEDVLGFCASSTGADTAGTWHMVLDGSAVGMPKNSTDSISASEDGNLIYLTTQGTFNVPPAVGGHSMVYIYDRDGEVFSGPDFSAPANGLNQKVNGLHVTGDLP